MQSQLDRLKRLQEEISRKNAIDKAETERMMKDLFSIKAPQLAVKNEWIANAKPLISQAPVLKQLSEFKPVDQKTKSDSFKEDY